jgi:hypothetical protein
VLRYVRAVPRTVALLLGLVLAVVAGASIAVAAPTDEGRPTWSEVAPQRITGTVVSVGEHELVLDGLVSYDPPRGGIGTLVVALEARTEAAAGDTIDVVVRRDGGRWVADEVVLLDPE